LKNQKEVAENREVDPKEIWEEIQRAASKAPEWASLEAPYAVKRRPVEEKEASPAKPDKNQK